MGGILRTAPADKGFLHHKFCVIDRETVITGSYNWTYYAETRNLENIIIFHDPDSVNAYLKEFNLFKDTYQTDNSRRVSWDEIGQDRLVDLEILSYK